VPQPNLLEHTNKYLAAGIPFILAPTGSMANNGALTLGTALPTTYANAYVYLPANAIAAGSAAGWYFAQFSSTTVGTVYNNTYTSGLPAIPAVLVPFVTTGPGAYTGVTTQVTGLSMPVDANALGPNGWIYVMFGGAVAITAGVKTFSVTLGGATLYTNTATTATSLSSRVEIALRGNNAAVGMAGVNVYAAPAMQTTPPPNLAMTLQLAAATDFMVIEGVFAQFYYGP